MDKINKIDFILDKVDDMMSPKDLAEYGEYLRTIATEETVAHIYKFTKKMVK